MELLQDDFRIEYAGEETEISSGCTLHHRCFLFLAEVGVEAPKLLAGPFVADARVHDRQ